VIPLAHIAGMPVEETIASLGPALLLTFGAASATLRARLRRARSSARQDAHAQDEPRSARRRALGSAGEGPQGGVDRSLEALAPQAAVPQDVDAAADRQQGVGNGAGVGVGVDVALILR
jgi:hypothetical protein